MGKEGFSDADPTQYSALPPTELSGIRNRESVNTEAGRFHRFVEPDKKEHGAAEQFTARLLKGIINVSDVVSVQDSKGGTQYFSREMLVANIESETSNDELRADAYIFKHVFNDHDHKYGDPHNLNQKSGRAAHFDFHESRFLYGGDLEEPSPLLYLDLVPTLLRKTNLLLERLSGDDGLSFIESVIQSTGKDVRDIFASPDGLEFLNEKEASEYLQSTLLDRLIKIKALAEDRAQDLPSK